MDADKRRQTPTESDDPFGVPIETLSDAIAFNETHSDQELRYFGQELFLAAETTDLNDPATIAAYQAALARDIQIGGALGIDAVLQQYNLDALVAPTGTPAWTTDLINGDHFIGFGSSSPPAIVGYSIINVTAGNSFGLPVGISFIGTAFSEPMLIRLASGFEHVTSARQLPQFLATIPPDPGEAPGRNLNARRMAMRSKSDSGKVDSGAPRFTPRGRL